jgi:hypothetical protein
MHRLKVFSVKWCDDEEGRSGKWCRRELRKITENLSDNQYPDRDSKLGAPKYEPEVLNRDDQGKFKHTRECYPPDSEDKYELLLFTTSESWK